MISNKIRTSLVALFISVHAISFAQPSAVGAGEHVSKKVPHTTIKNQANTSTCWSFATTSLVESQAMISGAGEVDVSEMFTVRNVYKEKARNYILRQGKAQFSPGGLSHDVIHAIGTYGAMPESVYSGLLLGNKTHDHDQLDTKLQSYLERVLKTKPLSNDWMVGFEKILDDHLGVAPKSFMYREKTYTPETFAREVLKFDASDYVFITSFTHHPYYASFVLEVPDNFSSGSYYNVPLDELMSITENAIGKGFSVTWDGDVSNANFRLRNGYALNLKLPRPESFDPESPEEPADAAIRQKLFEELTTQDDHLMHIVAVEVSKSGKKFFVVKDSYGTDRPFKGYIKLSASYFAINTVSLAVPKSALEEEVRKKLGL